MEQKKFDEKYENSRIIIGEWMFHDSVSVFGGPEWPSGATRQMTTARLPSTSAYDRDDMLFNDENIILYSIMLHYARHWAHRIHDSSVGLCPWTCMTKDRAVHIDWGPFRGVKPSFLLFSELSPSITKSCYQIYNFRFLIFDSARMSYDYCGNDAIYFPNLLMYLICTHPSLTISLS